LTTGRQRERTPTQKIVLELKDWNEKTGTVDIKLRFVEFQRVSNLIIFVVDGKGDGENVRLDRISII
jgi:hypothetical protein